MRRLAVLAVLLAGGPAGATSLDEAEPTQVTAQLSGSTVTLTARIGFDVDGPDAGATQTAAIPTSAVVTGATVIVDGRSHRLVLDEQDHAISQFDAVAQHAGGAARTWVVKLATSQPGSLEVQLAAAHSTHMILDLTLEMASCFYRDRRYVLVPKSWFTHIATHPAPLSDDELDATCAPESSRPEHTEWVGFAAPDLAKRPAGETRIGAFVGRLPLETDHLARVEIDLSRELTRAPQDLHTAIVFDTSRSLSSDEVDTERALIASYVRLVPPQSSVQVIGYARDAQPLLPAWLPAVAAAPQIDREMRARAPRNGSNVDDAIKEAGRWLAKVKGTRRLIVISDERFATRIEMMQGVDFKSLLPDHTLVHVVDLASAVPGLTAVDREDLGNLAALTEGIVVDAAVDASGKLDATMLVRPIQFDRISLQGAGWEPLGVGASCPTVDNGIPLGEGTSCTSWWKGRAIAGAFTLEGYLWGHKITRTLLPDATSARHLARELSPLAAVLDQELVTQIDRAALAVNSVWSMITTWGGSDGYADIESWGFGRTGFGSSCCIGGGSSDSIGFSTGGPKLDLSAQLAPLVAKCHAQSPVHIWLETTLEEIVAVEVTTPESEDVRRCIEDAIWNTAFAIPNAPWHSHATSTITPK